MKGAVIFLAVVAAALAKDLQFKPIVGGLSGTAATTRYWDCCKPSCAWKKNIRTPDQIPVATCAVDGSTVVNPIIQSGCNGGPAYMCSNQQPWQVDDNIGYGFGAASFTDVDDDDFELCCACFKLDFTDQLAGKSLILQVTNSGEIFGQNQFDIALPGGGVGLFTDGCHNQWNAPWSGWGDQYEGVSSREQCLSDLPKDLQSGCLFRFDFMFNATNPKVQFTQVECPTEIVKISGCNLKP